MLPLMTIPSTWPSKPRRSSKPARPLPMTKRFQTTRARISEIIDQAKDPAHELFEISRKVKLSKTSPSGSIAHADSGLLRRRK